MSATKSKTVFISGSAYEYGRFGDSGQDFIRSLTRSLVKNNFKIVSGFGVGVGKHIVEGALEEIYLEKRVTLKDHLQIFPFPAGSGVLENIFENYRHDIISQAGIVIFLFGNKLEDISVREADGMWQEFEIARSHRAMLIPVGASGYTAEKLWKILLDKYDDYFQTRDKFQLFERLGRTCTRLEDVNELIDTIIRIAQ